MLALLLLGEEEQVSLLSIHSKYVNKGILFILASKEFPYDDNNRNDSNETTRISHPMPATEI
jgi:hypothetical protein